VELKPQRDWLESVSVQFDKADRYHCNWIDT
jgi:hypothetical protein